MPVSRVNMMKSRVQPAGLTRRIPVMSAANQLKMESDLISKGKIGAAKKISQSYNSPNARMHQMMKRGQKLKTMLKQMPRKY